MATEPDPKVVDFTQARANAVADAVNMLLEQFKLQNLQFERLGRDLGYLKSDLSRVQNDLHQLRGEVEQVRNDMKGRFDRVDYELRDLRSELLLQANQMINAQQAIVQSVRRIERLLPDPANEEES